MYTIRQKQEITDRLKDESKFSKDLQLFQKKFPRSPMNRELARVNNVNRGALCGRMIYALLDVTTEEEIIRNRKNQPTEKAENETVAESAEAAAAGTGEQPEKQLESQSAENKKKDGKKRSSRK